MQRHLGQFCKALKGSGADSVVSTLNYQYQNVDSYSCDVSDDL